MDSAFTFIVGSLFMSALMASVFLFRSRKAAREVGYHRLSYSMFIKLFALAGVSLILTGVIFMPLSAPLMEALEGLLVISPILALVGAGLAETLLFELRYDVKRISQRSPWSGEKEISFGQLIAITRSRVMDQILLVSEDGTNIRVPKQINGSEELLRNARLAIQARDARSDS